MLQLVESRLEIDLQLAEQGLLGARMADRDRHVAVTLVEGNSDEAIAAIGLTDGVLGYDVRAAALEPLEDLLMGQRVSGDLVVMSGDDHEADGPRRQEIGGTVDE